MATPRVAAIHDMSGFGRCSLTIVIPVLSAMGVQCCPVPTAYLSTHTGGFSGNTFLDMTEELPKITAHWRELELRFDGVYTGFMSSCRQMELTAEFIRAFDAGAVVVDPVMGDHGRPYRTYTPEMCRSMIRLAELGDVITPNRTEAAILLGEDYEKITLHREEDCLRWARALSRDGRRSVVLKGISPREGHTGAVCFDHRTGQTALILQPRVEGQFHGTGDIFASVLSGALARGDTLFAAAEQAAEFTRICAARTAAQDIPRREGVDFEPLLWHLSREAANFAENTGKNAEEQGEQKL